MVRSLFGNSNRKLRSTFWGSPFIPVGMHQMECCLSLTDFSVPSCFQTHATQIRPFLDSNRNGCGISIVNWWIAYHYAFDTPTDFFCQMVSTPGRYVTCLPVTTFLHKNGTLHHPVSNPSFYKPITWPRSDANAFRHPKHCAREKPLLESRKIFDEELLNFEVPTIFPWLPILHSARVWTDLYPRDKVPCSHCSCPEMIDL